MTRLLRWIGNLGPVRRHELAAEAYYWDCGHRPPPPRWLAVVSTPLRWWNGRPS